LGANKKMDFHHGVVAAAFELSITVTPEKPKE
jgi:hypothetical protein